MSADVIEICEIGIKANIMFERHDIISQLTVNQWHSNKLVKQKSSFLLCASSKIKREKLIYGFFPHYLKIVFKYLYEYYNESR